MLTRLQVRNYVLIDSLDVEFPEGLIIITGQTGAGKSILLGALSLVMGAKADAGMISDGADNCVVEAEFDVDPSDAQLKAELTAGERYWFTSDEEQEIQEQNTSFYQVRPEEELLRTRFRAPLPGECPEMLSLVDILAGLRSEHAHLLRPCDMKRLGIILQTLGMEKVHTRLGNRYKVVRV